MKKANPARVPDEAEQAARNVRAWLRAEIARRLQPVAIPVKGVKKDLANRPIGVNVK